MPLVGLLLFHAALGLAAARAASRELRASPRAAVWTRAFAALGGHEALVGMPLTLYLLLRFGDWMVSYLVDGAHLPSAGAIGLVLLQGAAALGGFTLGARWLRAHHPDRVLAVAGALVALGLVGAVLLRSRVGVVGSYVQFRGGFGVVGLFRARLFGTLAALGALYLASLGHLFWSLRARL